jgi:hypothetical protein
MIKARFSQRVDVISTVQLNCSGSTFVRRVRFPSSEQSFKFGRTLDFVSVDFLESAAVSGELVHLRVFALMAVGPGR